MKYFAQRDTSTEYSRFLIFDEKGEKTFSAFSKRTASGEVFRLSDESRTLAKVRELNLAALRAFSITTESETARLVITDAKTLSIRFYGISFFVRGDVLGGCYDIVDADRALICSVSENAAKGCLEIEIFSQARAIFCLCAMMCIDSIRSEKEPQLLAT